MNMFKDMFANVRNLVGGRSAAVEDTMRDSRETVMQELKREAHAKGANAVIAVDLDYTSTWCWWKYDGVGVSFWNCCCD